MSATTRTLTTAILLGMLLLPALPGCDIAVVTVDPAGSPYRSKHFTIYYDGTSLSPGDVEVIAYRKERLLEHINDYLGTHYDGVIEVFVTDTSSGLVVSRETAILLLVLSTVTLYAPVF